MFRRYSPDLWDVCTVPSCFVLSYLILSYLILSRAVLSRFVLYCALPCFEADEDMRTAHAALWGASGPYQFAAADTLEQLAAFFADQSRQAA